VHAVDTLESDSSLAVDNSFIEGDSQDLPGSATAPWKSQSSVNLQQVLVSPLFITHVSNIVQQSFRDDNMHLIGVIRQELAPTATTVQNVETSVRDNSAALSSLVATVSTLAQSMESLHEPVTSTQTTVHTMNSTLTDMVQCSAKPPGADTNSTTHGGASTQDSDHNTRGMTDAATGVDLSQTTRLREDSTTGDSAGDIPSEGDQAGDSAHSTRKSTCDLAPGGVSVGVDALIPLRSQ
jgi:hypothetical protein